MMACLSLYCRCAVDKDMKKSMVFLLIVFCFALWPLNAGAEEKKEKKAVKVDLEDLKKHAPFVYLDCWRCDKDFIRTEITFVNYVRVRQDSDIHVLITNQRNGAGGNEYTMEFIGRRQFEGLNNTVTYNTMPTDTSDNARRKQVENLKKGLFPFLMQTPLAEYLSVVFRQKLSEAAGGLIEKVLLEDHRFIVQVDRQRVDSGFDEILEEVRAEGWLWSQANILPG